MKNASPIRNFIKRYIDIVYSLVLLLIILVLAYVNHENGTWLLGWDSLSDEFNFKINFWRQFTGVWNEYQGLGTAGGHAHASDIPRFIYLLIASIFLPQNLVRYSYFFVTLYIGSLGMYFLVKYLFSEYKYKVVLAVVASIYYIFNLGTLQIFYVPFEMFNAQYMVLPWLFLYVTKFIKSGKVKHLLILVGFIILGLPQGYAPVLYYAMVGSIGIYCLGVILINPNRLKSFYRSIIIGASFIISALYWILPNIYFVLNYSEKVANSKINRLFSEDAFLYSSKWGTIWDVMIMRGFLFGWLIQKPDKNIGYLMFEWRNYISQPQIYILGIVIFALIVIGAIFTIVKREKRVLPFLPLLIISLFMVIGANGVLAPIWELLRSHVGLVREGLRFPYTKFSILLQFTYTIFLVYGIYFVTNIGKKTRKMPVLITSTVVVIFVIIFTLPFFKGGLIAEEMNVTPPAYYDELYEYFENEDHNKRILYLPVNDLFGWVYYDWGEQKSYQGAGFVWFGLPQSFITRDFDRWHPANEKLYEEFQYALYSKDSDLVKDLLEKYSIDYIVLDQSVTAPNAEKSVLVEDTIELLRGVVDLKVTNKFGKLLVYNYGNNQATKYISTPDSYIYENKIFDGVYIKPDNADVVIENNNKKLDIDNAKGFIIEKSDIEELKSEYNIDVKPLTIEGVFPGKLFLLDDGLVIRFVTPDILTSTGSKIYGQSLDKVFTIDFNEYQVMVGESVLGAPGFGADQLFTIDSDVVAFSKQPEEKINYSDKIYSAMLTDCASGDFSSGKEFDKYPGSVILETEAEVVCLEFTQTINSINDEVLKVNLDYKNTLGSLPMYCLYDEEKELCLNNQYERRPFYSEEYSSYQDYVYIDEPANIKLVLLIASDDKNITSRGYFKDIVIERYPVLDKEPIITNYEYSKLNNGVNKNLLRTDFPLSIVLPELSLLSHKYQPGEKYFNPEKKNCDYFNKDMFERDLKNGEYIYSARDSISCDAVDSRHISPIGSYLIDFDVEHIEGKYLDICIDGKKFEKCLIKDRLDGKFDSYILPSYPDAGSVGINISNQSIGRVLTENKLKSISVDYIPYKWLSGISISNNDQGLYRNNLDVDNVNKKSVYSYEIGLIDNGDGHTTDSLLVLEQSYDKGWAIYDDRSCLFRLKSPLTCKKIIAEHVVAKGWANGWLLPNDQTSILVLFRPQYLQFFGYFALLAYVTSLIVILVSQKGNKQAKNSIK